MVGKLKILYFTFVAIIVTCIVADAASLQRNILTSRFVKELLIYFASGVTSLRYVIEKRYMGL